MLQNYSVLMSVYHREKPEYLWEGMENIFRQIVPMDNTFLI